MDVKCFSIRSYVKCDHGSIVKTIELPVRRWTAGTNAILTRGARVQGLF